MPIVKTTALNDLVTVQTSLRMLNVVHFVDATLHASYRSNVERAIERIESVRASLLADTDPAHVS